MNIGALDLNFLRYLEVMIEEENVSRAAVRLNMSQPGLSSAMSKMRTLLNDQILVRTSAGMVPTPYAIALLEAYTAFKHQVESVVVSKSQFDPSVNRRTFRVECFDFTLAHYLAPVFSLIKARGYQTEIVVHQMADNNFRERLEAGRVDLIVGFIPELAGTLKVSKIKTLEFACIASADHPTIRGTISKEEYLAASHVGLSFGGEGTPTYLERYLASAFASHGHERHTEISLPSFAGVAHFVASSALIATTPLEFAREAAAGLPIQVLPLPIDWHCDYGMAWHLRADADPAHKWFRGIVRNVANGKI